jgi:hypothetical protein
MDLRDNVMVDGETRGSIAAWIASGATTWGKEGKIYVPKGGYVEEVRRGSDQGKQLLI